MLIITTVLSIDSFYEHVFSEEKEPITQLKRRCGTYIEMDRMSIMVSVWDDKLMRYSTQFEYKNTLLDDIIPKERKTEEDILKHVSSLMPFLELEEDPFHLQPLNKEWGKQ